MNNVQEFINNLRMFDCLDLNKLRIGNNHDGGYVTLKEICAGTKTVYSFGIGDDIGFELDFAYRFPGTDIMAFDPTIEKLPEGGDSFNFFKLGIMEWINYASSSRNPTIAIENNSLLKIDVEWNEWDAILALTDQDLVRFSQILMELHIVHAEPRANLTEYFHNFYQGIFDEINNNLFAKYAEVMQRLTEHFYIFHMHPNNSLQQIQIGGYSIPPLLELSLVRKDLIVSNIIETQSQLPIEGLDFPNKPDRGDIMGWYPIC
jgi:hypothetical protein